MKFTVDATDETKSIRSLVAAPEFESGLEFFVNKLGFKIMMISPADSSNELIKLEDNGLVFRTTPPKIRGSQILADITSDRRIKKVAISHGNNKDYK